VDDDNVVGVVTDDDHVDNADSGVDSGGLRRVLCLSSRLLVVQAGRENVVCMCERGEGNGK